MIKSLSKWSLTLPFMAFLIFFHLSGCVKRNGEYFSAIYPYTGTNYVFVGMEKPGVDGNLVCFQMEMSSGLLTYKSQIDTEISPKNATYSPFSKSVYVANYASGTVTVYNVNSKDCSMTRVQKISGLSQVTSLVTDSNRGLLYVGYQSGVQPFTIASNGFLTTSGNLINVGGAVKEVAYYPNIDALFVNRDNTALVHYTISVGPTYNLVSAIGFTNLVDIEYEVNVSTGKYYLFAADAGANVVKSYEVNTSNGGITLVDTLSTPAPASIIFYLAAPATLIVQNSTGTLRSYTQSSTGALSLYATNTDVSDTAAPSMTTGNVNVHLLTLSSSNGVNSWVQSNSTGMLFFFRRSTPLFSYGTTPNFLFGSIQ